MAWSPHDLACSFDGATTAATFIHSQALACLSATRELPGSGTVDVFAAGSRFEHMQFVYFTSAVIVWVEPASAPAGSVIKVYGQFDAIPPQRCGFLLPNRGLAAEVRLSLARGIACCHSESLLLSAGHRNVGEPALDFLRRP